MQDAENPDDFPSDDDSIWAVCGDPDDREELDVTIVQEFLFSCWWRIREEERLQMEEVDLWFNPLGEPPDPELVQYAHFELLRASDAAVGSAVAATKVSATLPLACCARAAGRRTRDQLICCDLCQPDRRHHDMRPPARPNASAPDPGPSPALVPDPVPLRFF